MIPSRLLLCVSLAVCGGCAHYDSSVVSSTYDPSTEARIRVFHGPSAYLYQGNICEPGEHPAIHAASGGFSYLTVNRVIGIPKTDDMHSSSYNEYVLPAGKMHTIKMVAQWQQNQYAWKQCAFNVLFTPEAGRDYETYLDLRAGGACNGLVLEEIRIDSTGRTIREPAPLNALPFVRC